jgi:hypothetical protein
LFHKRYKKFQNPDFGVEGRLSAGDGNVQNRDCQSPMAGNAHSSAAWREKSLTIKLPSMATQFWRQFYGSEKMAISSPNFGADGLHF